MGHYQSWQWQVNETLRTGDLRALEVDFSFVVGEKGSAVYVGVYDSWEEYVERIGGDPSGFADRKLESPPGGFLDCDAAKASNKRS